MAMAMFFLFIKIREHPVLNVWTNLHIVAIGN